MQMPPSSQQHQTAEPAGDTLRIPIQTCKISSSHSAAISIVLALIPFAAKSPLQYVFSANIHGAGLVHNAATKNYGYTQVNNRNLPDRTF